jgi:hypothetical protein
MKRFHVLAAICSNLVAFSAGTQQPILVQSAEFSAPNGRIAIPERSSPFRSMFAGMAILPLSELNSALCTSTQRPDSVGIPDIPGYRTLAGDFHLHTIFSDGQVTPSFRVAEARRDGLNFIALTDHTDYQGYPADLANDYQRPYALASKAASGTGLIVIEGAEISPRTPPYHMNAVFLRDASKITAPYMLSTRGEFVMKPSPTRAELMAPLLEARRQSAFITYNHPGYLYDWNPQTMGDDLLTPLHRDLLANGMLHGVEIVNGHRYYKKAHRMAIEHGLTLIAGSDEHGDIAATYRSGHRPMTLVFAKTSDAAGIREALFSHRTAVYHDDYIIGRKPEVEALFRASLAVTTSETNHNVEPLLAVHLENRSDLRYEIRASSTKYDFDTLPLGRAVIAPHSTTTLLIRTLWDFPEELSFQLSVENVLVAPDESLATTISVRPAWKKR